MGIFRKRKTPPDVVGADGSTYVHVPTEQAERYVGTLCDKAIDRVDEALTGWVQLALQTTFSTVVDRMRGEEVAPTVDTARFAFTAAKLGYLSRIVEFDDLDIMDENRDLTERMTAVELFGLDGSGWYPTVCGMADALVGFSIGGTDDPKIAAALTPVGAGFDVHRRMCVRQLGRMLRASDGTDFEADGITRPELAECWYYGYYLRACEMALPTTGRTALSDITRDD